MTASPELDHLRDLISNLILEACEYAKVGYLNYKGPIEAQRILNEELTHWKRTTP